MTPNPQVSKNFDVMPFQLGALADEKAAKLGVTECVKHDLVQPYVGMSELAGCVRSREELSWAGGVTLVLRRGCRSETRPLPADCGGRHIQLTSARLANGGI